METMLLRLAVRAYEAGSNPELWPDFLEGYARAASADASLIQVHRFAEHRSEPLATFGLAPRFRASYASYYSGVNVWRDRGEALYRRGRVILDQESYARALLEKSEFYNDYLRPMGNIYSMAGVVERERESALVLTLMRRRAGGPWEASDKPIAGFLIPHLRRAMAVQRQLWILQAGESVLDQLPGGVLLLSAEERLIYANCAADRILREGDGLSLRTGVLSAANPRTHALIQRAIRAAARLDAFPPDSHTVLVERKSARRAYQLVALPLRRKFPLVAGLGMPAVLVLITDPERELPISTHLIQSLYGLTPKEAELAKRLSAGMSPQQAGVALGMSYETARTHLKHIFDKMGVRRQSELAALIARLPRISLD